MHNFAAKTTMMLKIAMRPDSSIRAPVDKICRQPTSFSLSPLFHFPLCKREACFTKQQANVASTINMCKFNKNRCYLNHNPSVMQLRQLGRKYLTQSTSLLALEGIALYVVVNKNLINLKC